MDDAPNLRFALRYRRTSLIDKTLLKDSSARRKSFSAALQQFEEQMEAARIVTSATRPINLYYGLVQAGLAITAAYTPGNWSFGKHGLKVVDMQPDLPGITIRPDGDGAFQYVARATGSEQLADTVSLGELWASLPVLCQFPLKGAASPIALEFFSDRYAESADRTEYGPAYFRAEIAMNSDLPEQADRESWYRATMADYPGMANAQLWGDSDTAFRESRKGRFLVAVGWPVPRGKPAPDISEEEIEAFFDRLAPQYRFEGERFLRPPAGSGQTPPPSPLMTWWLLLYTFSMISRYQPRKWAEILDLDKSPNAAVVQHALEMALAVLPHLVLEALDKEPILFGRPLRL
ncbi:YaaC family protein [Streptomyces sp. NPDC006386]|uniref:YaaC family protein n=1 Tax=Streptomyces sp. NPDC006386 TaxID=3156762 RepID=UPI0033B2B45C